jgi:hypothetical protein
MSTEFQRNLISMFAAVPLASAVIAMTVAGFGYVI